MQFIPYGRQWIDKNDIESVVNVLQSDFLTTGPMIAKFEKDFSDYTGAKYAVAVANGTAALHAACFASGVKEGDEVITTPITFAASANCVLYCGGTPVFADIDPQTYNISPKEILKKITKKTKAIIPVHFTGQPCEMDEINEIAEKYGLTVIEDAAHGLGASYKGKKIGDTNHMATFSFHPVKHITTGEGGMITTNDEEFYKKLKLFRTHGITRESDEMENNDGGFFYEQAILGYNYRLSDIHAALGVSQLKKIDDFLTRRKELVKKYNEAFRQIDGLVIPAEKQGCESSWHLYIIQVTKKPRKDVYDFLQKANIGVNVHYIPVYKHPYYKKLGYGLSLPNSENLYKNIISLPLYYGLKDQEADYVIEKVKEAVRS